MSIDQDKLHTHTIHACTRGVRNIEWIHRTQCTITQKTVITQTPAFYSCDCALWGTCARVCTRIHDIHTWVCTTCVYFLFLVVCGVARASLLLALLPVGTLCDVDLFVHTLSTRAKDLHREPKSKTLCQRLQMKRGRKDTWLVAADQPEKRQKQTGSGLSKQPCPSVFEPLDRDTGCSIRDMLAHHGQMIVPLGRTVQDGLSAYASLLVQCYDDWFQEKLELALSPEGHQARQRRVADRQRAQRKSMGSREKAWNAGQKYFCGLGHKDRAVALAPFTLKTSEGRASIMDRFARARSVAGRKDAEYLCSQVCWATAGGAASKAGSDVGRGICRSGMGIGSYMHHPGAIEAAWAIQGLLHDKTGVEFFMAARPRVRFSFKGGKRMQMETTSTSPRRLLLDCLDNVRKSPPDPNRAWMCTHGLQGVVHVLDGSAHAHTKTLSNITPWRMLVGLMLVHPRHVHRHMRGLPLSMEAWWYNKGSPCQSRSLAWDNRANLAVLNRAIDIFRRFPRDGINGGGVVGCTGSVETAGFNRVDQEWVRAVVRVHPMVVQALVGCRSREPLGAVDVLPIHQVGGPSGSVAVWPAGFFWSDAAHTEDRLSVFIHMRTSPMCKSKAWALGSLQVHAAKYAFAQDESSTRASIWHMWKQTVCPDDNNGGLAHRRRVTELELLSGAFAPLAPTIQGAIVLRQRLMKRRVDPDCDTAGTHASVCTTTREDDAPDMDIQLTDRDSGSGTYSDSDSDDDSSDDSSDDELSPVYNTDSSIVPPCHGEQRVSASKEEDGCSHDLRMGRDFGPTRHLLESNACSHAASDQSNLMHSPSRKMSTLERNPASPVNPNQETLLSRQARAALDGRKDLPPSCGTYTWRMVTFDNPWGQLIADGIKPLENRSEVTTRCKNFAPGMWVAVHTSKCKFEKFLGPHAHIPPAYRQIPRRSGGHIVALARVGHVVSAAEASREACLACWVSDDASKWCIVWDRVAKLHVPIEVTGGQGQPLLTNAPVHKTRPDGRAKDAKGVARAEKIAAERRAAAEKIVNAIVTQSYVLTR